MTNREAKIEAPADGSGAEVGWLEERPGIRPHLDPTWTFENISECRERLGVCAADGTGDVGRVFTLEHLVPVGDGLTLYVKEFFTMGSWLRRPRRAVLFLNGSVFNGSCWSIPVPGYDGAEMVARRGMFAYTVDYIGTGRSTKVENGRDTSMGKSFEHVHEVLKTIRYYRAIPRVDLVGEGYGGNIACRLGADTERARSCVLIAMAYKDVVSGPTKSPEMLELLTNSPDGYHPIPPQAYGPFLVGAPREVREYICSTQAGEYPVHGNLLAQNVPIFDPSVARVPGLVLYGAKDFVVGPRDPYDLAEDYGCSGARLEVNEEAGHAPRIEAPESARWLWGQIFDFIDA